MKRIFPKYAPHWFRPAWCFFLGYHRRPLEVFEGMPIGSHVNCGCCGKLRATVVETPDFEASTSRDQIAEGLKEIWRNGKA